MNPPSHPAVRYLSFISSLFITSLIVSNIVAGKIANFGGFFLPAAVIIFPVSYIISNILTEVYGFAVMRRVIWTGFLCNFLAVAILWIAIRLPSAPFFTGQEAFAATLGATPRILGASLLAYLFGEFTNATILAKMKVHTHGRFLWLRIIVSTVIGEGLDSLLFISLAFWGVFPGMQIFTVVLMQWTFKVGFEILATPITYWIVGLLKRAEKMDHFDTQTSFNPLPFLHANR